MVIILAICALVGGYFFLKYFDRIDSSFFGSTDADYEPFGMIVVAVCGFAGAVAAGGTFIEEMFQLGALMFPFLVIVPFFGCLIANLLMFLGLKGIIQSDLVTEERSGEDCGVVSGGWWSRPVKAMVCFYGCFLVLGVITAVLSANL